MLGCAAGGQVWQNSQKKTEWEWGAEAVAGEKSWGKRPWGGDERYLRGTIPHIRYEKPWESKKKRPEEEGHQYAIRMKIKKKPKSWPPQRL